MKEAIQKLVKEKNAIILAHNYVPAEIQEIADLCGDSLELSIRAAKTGADMIVFCGVRFMAETAAILSPDKTVLLPAADAGCPMADMITPESLRKKKEELPGVPVVTYVNSTAAVKALSDICCTSANALRVVESIPEKEVLMAPDKNLARYVAANTRKKIHFWEGSCPFHDQLSAEAVKNARAEHPEAFLIAHPECPSEVLELADAISSTSGMVNIARQSPKREFIIATETGLLPVLEKACPDKIFYPASKELFCPDMKKITLEILLQSLEKEEHRISVPEEIRIPALAAVERMLAI